MALQELTADALVWFTSSRWEQAQREPFHTWRHLHSAPALTPLGRFLWSHGGGLRLRVLQTAPHISLVVITRYRCYDAEKAARPPFLQE